MTARNMSASGDSAVAGPPLWLVAAPLLSITRHILTEYIRSGWILVELLYVLALYLFAFGYPFEPSFFFGTANWGLGLLAVCATLLLVARAMRPTTYRLATAQVPRRTYVAGLALAAATLRAAVYLLLLALALLSHHLINATAGTLLAGSIGLLAGNILLAALALALSPAFTPRSARQPSPPSSPSRQTALSLVYAVPRFSRLIFLAWLVAALSSYAASGPLAALLFVARLPLLPLFACFGIGVTGMIGWRDVLALLVVAGYVVGLVFLAGSWLARRDATSAVSETDATEESAEPTGTLASANMAAPERQPAKEPATLARSAAQPAKSRTSQGHAQQAPTPARRPPARKRPGR